VVQIKAKLNFFFPLTYLYNYSSGMNKISSVVFRSRERVPVDTFVISPILYEERNFQRREWNYHQL
jgi:hypothetical protein